MTTPAPPLARIEAYLDAVPRVSGRAEDFGPLTLFVAEAGSPFPYYARPTPGWAGTGAGAGDVRRVRERQRELGLPESFEWIGENAPALRGAAEDAGLAVRERPLMLLDPGRAPVPAAGPPCARVLAPGDPALPSALAVPHLAFAEPGTRAREGLPTLADAVRLHAPPQAVIRAADRIRAGHTVVAAALDEGGQALCAGQLLPLGPTTELVAIGTLPGARRRGLGAAVTGTLVAEAHRRGLTTVFLMATDDRVARLYARHGFRVTGTATFAEPAPAPSPPA
ncbi:GNAT family N-acetyltransferase [Streptomyces iconiensis]|uniref:GNAT family N-acetyltransferase n=1 Tax=Streptomyces iconiensis TaxID=1384038 RepID=A0ABT6ZWI1_9ACTN|nr:GNAT family N-acetyltransferase [Streptomyces iconiensis]MDJ1133430.1 GNAT family N-acetyltransferase [Streptomyces iconiensis]